MKILHVSGDQTAFGAKTAAMVVILDLHKAGIDQMVVMPKTASSFGEIEKAGVKLLPFPWTLPFRFLQKLFLAWLIRREKPDVVQVWDRRAAALASCKPSMPIIAWFGGYDDPRHFRGCTDFIGASKDIAEHLVRNGVASDHVHIIPVAPDIVALPPVDRAALATPRDAKVLLTLSRLHPEKGLDDFLQALALMPECYGWLEGEGPLRRELEALAQKLGVMERVRFLGRRADRAALLRAADICVLPSRREPFGSIIPEAWAAGVPLVAAQSAGPAVLIEDNLSGILVPIGDAEALAVGLRRVLSDGELRQRLIAHGYAAYIKGYTSEAVTRQWEEAYKRLVKNGVI